MLINQTFKSAFHLSSLLLAPFSISLAGSDWATAAVTKQHRNYVTRRLRRALRAGELQIHYQPIVRLSDGHIVAAEALLRWPDAGISIEQLISYAEDSGMISDITRYVLAQVTSDLALFLQRDKKFHVTVNVTASELIDGSLTEHEQILHAAGISANSVGFEITERTSAPFDAVRTAVMQLKQTGHPIYIDDFGIGYSNLSLLSTLNVDTIKLDGSFTKAPSETNIIPEILTMAHRLGINAVIEGIETQAQADHFREAGTLLLGQGWYFGRPQPIEALLLKL